MLEPSVRSFPAMFVAIIRALKRLLFPAAHPRDGTQALRPSGPAPAHPGAPPELTPELTPAGCNTLQPSEPPAQARGIKREEAEPQPLPPAANDDGPAPAEEGPGVGADDEDEEDVAAETEEENELSPPASICRPPEEVEAELQAARTLAEQEALSGEHRLYPSTAVGPGSLGEALRRLEDEGRLESEYVEDGAEAYLRYRPLSDGAGPTADVVDLAPRAAELV